MDWKLWVKNNKNDHPFSISIPIRSQIEEKEKTDYNLVSELGVLSTCVSSMYLDRRNREEPGTEYSSADCRNYDTVTTVIPP